MEKTFYLLILFGTFFISSNYAQDIELIGLPGPVLIMKINPINQNYLYSGDYTNGGSFFRTTDGGITNEWIDLMEIWGVSMVECDYNNPDVFYASLHQDSYIKTTDGGKSWKKILKSSQMRYDIEVNKLDHSSLLAIHNHNQIWKSYNGGDTWFLFLDLQKEISQIAISPLDTSTIYVAALNSLYRTTDGGRDWVMTTKISDVYPNIECDRMVLNPVYDNIIDYLIAGHIYRTYNNGFTLEILFNGATDFATNPSNPQVIYATRNGDLFKTTDGGKTWNLFNGGFSFSSIQAGEIEISNQDPDVLYVSTYYGIYKTTNGGESWFYTRSASTQAYRLTTFSENPNSLLVLTRRGDPMKTSDNGINWYNPAIDTFIKIGFDFYAIDPFNESSGYFANGLSLYKTTDYGDSWFDTGKLPEAVEVKYHPYLQDVIFARSYQNPYILHRSTDGGNSWKDINDTTTARIISNQVNPLKLFSLDNYGIRRSTDLGSSWNLIKKSEPVNIISSIAMPVNSENIVYLGLGANGELPGHLSKSTDGGDTWIEIDSVLHQMDDYVDITSISIDNGNLKRFFVGLSTHGMTSQGGLFLTEDDGKSWTKLFNSRVDFIQMYYGNPKYIYFGTKFGIMRMRDSALVSVNDYEINMPEEYSLSQNYPNPFNPNTIIKYQIPVNGLVSLKIYDILGKEISTLVNEEKSAGRYEVNFNASDLASGVYIYRVKVNEFVESRKMVLMK